MKKNIINIKKSIIYTLLLKQWFSLLLFLLQFCFLLLLFFYSFNSLILYKNYPIIFEFSFSINFLPPVSPTLPIQICSNLASVNNSSSLSIYNTKLWRSDCLPAINFSTYTNLSSSLSTYTNLSSNHAFHTLNP